MIFNEQGIINIDEALVQEPSFRNIMEDGVVTDEELLAQSQRVIGLLQDVEARFSPEDITFIQKLLAETNVLTAIYHYHELQNLK
ncbi:MAG: hypothetical protein IJ618_10545 [Prevotella sp.]|nr:hypothetical protein [Prevotella sp.]